MELREAFLASKLFCDGGGGGGQSDLTLSNMTISSVDGMTVYIEAPIILSMEGVSASIPRVDIDADEMTFALIGVDPSSASYAGFSGMFFLTAGADAIPEQCVTITGPAEYQDGAGKFFGGDFSVVVDLSLM